MKMVLKLSSIFVIIALSIFLCVNIFTLPSIKPSDAPKEDFSAERAMKHVDKIAADIHQLESKDHEYVKNYILNEITALGLKPELQTGYSENIMKGRLRFGNIENISTVLTGNGSTNDKILAVAHYDSTSGGPGAADDASGVATLLETIRALKESPSLKNDIIFLITDGEEGGLLGAKAFVAKSSLLKDVSLVLNFEARGNTGPMIMFETADNNAWLMEGFKKAAPDPVAFSFAYDVYKYMPNDTDFTLFKNAGKLGFNFASVEGYETYHNADDTPQNINRQTLQHEGSYSLSLLKYFGNMYELNRESGNSVYFSLVKGIFILYPDQWAMPLAIAALLLFIVCFAVGRRRKVLTFKGSITAVFSALFTLAVSSGIGLLGNTLFNQKFRKNGSLNSYAEYKNILSQGNHWICALILITLTVVTIFNILLVKRTAHENLICGYLFIWLIPAMVSGIAFKSASYLFLWPSIFMLVGLLIKILSMPGKASSFSSFILMLFTTASCILIFVPILFLLFQAMTMGAAAILTGIAALPAGAIIITMIGFMKNPSSIGTKETTISH